jgi:hypothetical protein
MLERPCALGRWGEGAQMPDVIASFQQRNLDVGVLASFFSADLNPDAIVLTRGAIVVFAVELPVEDDGWRAGSDGPRSSS